MTKVLKLNRVYEKNAARLRHWAEQGLPYSILIAQQGCDDITPLFSTKANADNFLRTLKAKGLNAAVAFTEKESEGGSYKYFVSAATVKAPF